MSKHRNAFSRSVFRGSLGSALLLALTAAAVPSATAAAPHTPHRPHAPGVQRVSTAADGTQADGASSAATTTPNGRFVGFRSSATNLVPEGITHPGTYGYVRDLRTGTVTKFEDALGTPEVSADGRYATYTGRSRNVHVFLTDLRTGTRTRIDSADTRGSAGAPTISADGRYTAFTWHGHPQDPARIDLYDRVTGTHETVSAGPQDDSTRDMDNASISGNGRYVAYQDNGTGDVWVADRTTGTRTEADDGTRSTVVQLSADGRTLALNSADGDAYVRDLRTGRVQHLPGVRATAVSPDGRQLLHLDSRSALRLRDLRTGADRAVTDADAGAGALPGAVSDKGVVFAAGVPDLVPDDTNGVPDVFVRRVR